MGGIYFSVEQKGWTAKHSPERTVVSRTPLQQLFIAQDKTGQEHQGVYLGRGSHGWGWEEGLLEAGEHSAPLVRALLGAPPSFPPPPSTCTSLGHFVPCDLLA